VKASKINKPAESDNTLSTRHTKVRDMLQQKENG
jgi:hypothetical protein